MRNLITIWIDGSGFPIVRESILEVAFSSTQLLVKCTLEKASYIMQGIIETFTQLFPLVCKTIIHDVRCSWQSSNLYILDVDYQISWGIQKEDTLSPWTIAQDVCKNPPQAQGFECKWWLALQSWLMIVWMAYHGRHLTYGPGFGMKF